MGHTSLFMKIEMEPVLHDIASYSRRQFLRRGVVGATAAGFVGLGALPCPGGAPARPFQPEPEGFPDLFAWTDTCNVYVLRAGDEAILINLGNGSVLDHLAELGIKRVAWVLITDHHREQHQGIERIDRTVTQIAAPKAEQALLETPTEFRKWHARLGDKHTVHGASYVRPPRTAISLDRVLKPGETFTWKGINLTCLGTPGHSPGGMTYTIRQGDKTAAFVGGVMHDGARMTNWFDTEWDYGFAKGIDTLIATVENLLTRRIALALPSQGPAITNPKEQFRTYRQKLATFRKRYVRGYPVFKMAEEDQDSVSQPTDAPHVNRVTPHLYKLSRNHAGKNFGIIVSDNGRGLVLDGGLFSEAMLDEIIAGMRRHMGLKEIDAMWVSHMHGDHFLLGPVLQRKYGAKTWTLDRIADKCENPHRYDYAALVSAYGAGIDGMKIDRRFRDGETIEWEGCKIQVDWMPGQTEFGCCLWLELDGKRIAFTGDNIFGNPEDKKQNGHEAVVARNSAIFEEGYLYAAQYLQDLKPDILMGGHSFVMHAPAEFIDRYHAWAREIIKLYRGLLPDEAYEYLFDPYWVSAYPYRVDLSDHDQTVSIRVRNFRDRPQRHRIELKLPPGVTAKPQVLDGVLPGRSRESFPVELVLDRDASVTGLHIATLDITLDNKCYGELFDFLVRLPDRTAEGD